MLGNADLVLFISPQHALRTNHVDEAVVCRRSPSFPPQWYSPSAARLQIALADYKSTGQTELRGKEEEEEGKSKLQFESETKSQQRERDGADRGGEA